MPPGKNWQSFTCSYLRIQETSYKILFEPIKGEERGVQIPLFLQQQPFHHLNLQARCSTHCLLAEKGARLVSPTGCVEDEDRIQAGYRSSCPFSMGLCMDVFVAACFYPPDHAPISFMVKVSIKIKESSHFDYESVYLMCCLPNVVEDTRISVLNAQPPRPAAGKVSGLDSYMDSSSTSLCVMPELNATDNPTMLKSLAAAKVIKASSAGDKRFPLGVRGVAKDIKKLKSNKKSAHIAVYVQELENPELISEGMQANENDFAEDTDGKAMVKDGESPAKCSRRSPSLATPLTGAHEEPRQAQ